MSLAAAHKKQVTALPHKQVTSSLQFVAICHSALLDATFATLCNDWVL